MKRPAIIAATLFLLSAGATNSVQLPNIGNGERLFNPEIPSDGYWSFCLRGSKPALDLFLVRAQLNRGDAGTFRLDGMKTVRAEDTAIDVCIRQNPGNAGETKLKKGEKVELVSVGATRGPVVLNLTVTEVK